jgi:hypothetical protein
MAGVQSGTSEKFLVGREPVAPRRDGQGRVGGSGTAGPWGVTGAQQLLDDGPGPGTEPEGNRVWVTAALLDDLQGHRQGCRPRIPLWRGDQAQKATAHQRGHAIRAPTLARVLAPVAIGRVVCRFVAVA